MEALDVALGNAEGEAGEQPTALAIEHILPQKWDEHWPLPKAMQKNPQGKQAFTEQRERLKHTLGNLTLVAGSLNPAQSRAPWGGEEGRAAQVQPAGPEPRAA
ncbi:MAG: HNH endonuclease family protein [Pseudomonas sp.]|nr:HNH endonuclease family protein [Pseudomonas sp.]